MTVLLGLIALLGMQSLRRFLAGYSKQPEAQICYHTNCGVNSLGNDSSSCCFVQVHTFLICLILAHLKLNVIPGFSMACVQARVHCLYSPLFLRSLAPAISASGDHGKCFRRTHRVDACVSTLSCVRVSSTQVVIGRPAAWDPALTVGSFTGYIHAFTNSFFHKPPLPFLGSCRSCIAQAQPSKKGPEKTVKIYCAKCQEQLYKYKKVQVQRCTNVSFSSAWSCHVTLIHICTCVLPHLAAAQHNLCTYNIRVWCDSGRQRLPCQMLCGAHCRGCNRGRSEVP